MRVREKGRKDAEPVHMDFGQAQAALQSGAYEVVEDEGERGPEVRSGVWGDGPPAPIEPEPKSRPEPKTR